MTTTTTANNNSNSGKNEKQQPKKQKKKRTIRKSMFRKVKDQQWARKLIQIKKGRKKKRIQQTTETAAMKEGGSCATSNSATTWVSFSALGKSIQKHMKNKKKTTIPHPDQDSSCSSQNSNSRSDNGTNLSSHDSEPFFGGIGTNTSMMGNEEEQPQQQQVIAHWLQQQASAEVVVEHWCQQQAVLAAASTIATTTATTTTTTTTTREDGDEGFTMPSCNSNTPEEKEERTEEADVVMEAGTVTATTTSIAIDERETVADSTPTPPSRTTLDTAIAETLVPSNSTDDGAATARTNSRLAAALSTPMLLETEEAAAFSPSLAPGTPTSLPRRQRIRSSTVLMTGHLRLDHREAVATTARTVVNDDQERPPLSIIKDGQLHPDLIFGGYYHLDETVEEEDSREEEEKATEEAGEGDGTTNTRTPIVTLEDPNSSLPSHPNTVDTHEHRQDEEEIPMMMDTIMEETQTTPLAIVPEEETNHDDEEDHDVDSDADSVMDIDTTMTTTTAMRLEGEEETIDDSIGSTAAAPRAMARVSTRTLGRGEQTHTPSENDTERLGMKTTTTIASSSMTTTSTIGRTTQHPRIPPPDLGVRNVYYDDENDNNEDSHHGTTMTSTTGMLYLGEATGKHEHGVCKILGVGTPECTVM